MNADPSHAGRARPVVVGIVLGIVAIGLAWWLGERPEEEYEQYFPRADAETIAAWTEEWHRRGDP